MRERVPAPSSIGARTAPRPAAAGGATAGGLVVTLGTSVSHLLGYLLNLLAARLLGPAEFGAVAALLGLMIVGTVPAMGLQAVAALRVTQARSPQARAGVERRLLHSGLTVGAVVTTLATAAAVPLANFLHLSSPVAAVYVGLSLLPMTLIGVCQGVLQGDERFPALSALFVAAGAGKVGGGIIGMVVAPTPTGLVLGAGLGSAIAAAYGWWLAVGHRPSRDGEGVWRDLWHSTHSLLAIFLLASFDVMLARHYLPAAAAGLYAVGAVIAKGTFWLPQAVSVVAFPRLADPARRPAALPAALGLVAGAGAITVAGTALLSQLAVQLVGGAAYAGLANQAWLFALLGSLLALAQLLLFSRLALADRSYGLALWLAVAGELALVGLWLHDSVTQIVLAAVTVAIALVAAGLLVEERERRQRNGSSSSHVPQDLRQP
jgi:O-antigen/teichoic acid export membrane protein